MTLLVYKTLLIDNGLYLAKPEWDFWTWHLGSYFELVKIGVWNVASFLSLHQTSSCRVNAQFLLKCEWLNIPTTFSRAYLSWREENSGWTIPRVYRARTMLKRYRGAVTWDVWSSLGGTLMGFQGLGELMMSPTVLFTTFGHWTFILKFQRCLFPFWPLSHPHRCLEAPAQKPYPVTFPWSQPCLKAVNSKPPGPLTCGSAQGSRSWSFTSYMWGPKSMLKACGVVGIGPWAGSQMWPDFPYFLS